MSLYLKYRPVALKQVIGNAEVIQTLQGLLANKAKCPHTFLLTGPTGCGKTTLARIIAKELDCNGSDYQEVNFANFRGIDTVREIVQNSIFMPLEGTNRVWVIDECHKMTNDAQNAFLKILEDTPGHVYFILCTTDPQKLLPTLKGRCSTFQVTPLDDAQMHGLLKRIAYNEQVPVKPEVIDQIVNSSNGLPRNAIQILEQVISLPEEMQLEAAKKSEQEIVQSIELCRALIKESDWKVVSSILFGLKDQDAEGIRRVVLGYCQAVLLKQDSVICGYILEEFMNPFYDSGFPHLVYACYSITKHR